jgi:hypothetical protein
MRRETNITSPLWGGRKSEAFSGGGICAGYALHPENSTLRSEFYRPPHKGEAVEIS